MNEKKLFTDGYNATFTQQSDFVSFLKERGKQSNWSILNTKTLRFFALDEKSC